MELELIYTCGGGCLYVLDKDQQQKETVLPKSLAIIKVNRSKVYQSGLVLVSRDDEFPLLVNLMPGGGGSEYLSELDSGERLRLSVLESGLLIRFIPEMSSNDVNGQYFKNKKKWKRNQKPM